MNTISQILSCSPSHEIDSFDWGVAELSSILHLGTTYEKVEVDFLEGEVRFYRHFDEKKLPQQQIPTLRRSINASITYCKCAAKPEPLEESEQEETQSEPKFDNHTRVQ
jgi:hypothetical protein